MKFWNRMVTRFGLRRTRWVTFLTGTAIVAVVMRLLLINQFYHSSLLYVLIPYCISMAIVLFRSLEMVTRFGLRRTRWITRFGLRRTRWVTFLTGIAIVAVVMRLLLINQLYHSSLLYVLIPYCISMAIVLFRSFDKPATLGQRYISHIVTALSVLFATSILLGEGFICIIFFAPIYLIVVTATYLMRFKFNKNKKYAIAFPILIVIASMEGTTPSLSLPRHTYVDVSQVTSLSVDQLKANLAKPFSLEKKRHWLISIFPMPYRIDAGSLNEGDVHTVYTRYHRWFFTNTHEGRSELKIEQVSANKVVTKVISDTTYFSTYLNGQGTEIDMEALPSGQTKVTLRLHYRRNLDPAWYFHPLQKFGVSKMGQLIISELMIREEQHEQ